MSYRARSRRKHSLDREPEPGRSNTSPHRSDGVHAARSHASSTDRDREDAMKVHGQRRAGLLRGFLDAARLRLYRSMRPPKRRFLLMLFRRLKEPLRSVGVRRRGCLLPANQFLAMPGYSVYSLWSPWVL